MSKARGRRIYLHVGQHKTGTTWIQQTFARNREGLAAQGILYPDLGPSQGWAMVRLFAKADDAGRLDGAGPRVIGRAPSAEVLDRYRQTLDAALRDATARKVVISGEQISERLRWNEIKALAEHLRQFGEVRVIAYLREPGSYAASMAAQRLKAGATLAALKADPPLPSYRQRLQKFLRHFGRKNVDLRLYDRKSLKNGDILADFLDAIEEPDLVLAPPAERAANEKMSRPAAALLNLRNRLFALLGPARARRNPPRLVRVFELIPGAPFALPPAIETRARRRSRPDLAWLESRLGRPPFPDAPDPGAGRRKGPKNGPKTGGGKGAQKTSGRKAGKKAGRPQGASRADDRGFGAAKTPGARKGRRATASAQPGSAA